MPNENWFSRLKIAGSHTAPIQSAGTNGKPIRAPSCAYDEEDIREKKTGLKSAKPKNDEQKNKNDRRREERKAQ